MFLVTRKEGSQRSSKGVKLSFEPSWTGQQGSSFLTLKSEDGRYYILKPETQEEMREFLSQVHILHHNFYDELERTERKNVLENLL